MPIIEIENVRGVKTNDGQVFCRDCYDGELSDPTIMIVNSDDVHREEGVNIYVCDACKEEFAQ